MRRWMGIPVAAVLLLTACVTINVYFPAAEAKEAAKEFVEKVIGDEAQPAQPRRSRWRRRHGEPGAAAVRSADRWSASAPPTRRARRTSPSRRRRSRRSRRAWSRASMRTLRAGFDCRRARLHQRRHWSCVRDAAKLALKDRVAVNQAVADDNRDRKAVYREVAVANGHPEWEAQIREVFAKQWIDSARSGWWYQDAAAAGSRSKPPRRARDGRPASAGRRAVSGRRVPAAAAGHLRQ